jgi:probable rRNA maturation factor
MNQPEINVVIKRSITIAVDKRWLEQLALRVLAVERIGPYTEMGLLITDSKTVQKLNKMYRGEDEPTDVLSFQMNSDAIEDNELPFVCAPDGIKHLGEVVVSYPQAMKQAKERGESIARELALLIIHGTLHLLGYDHELPDDAQVMRDKENQVLSLVEAVQ